MQRYAGSAERGGVDAVIVKARGDIRELATEADRQIGSLSERPKTAERDEKEKHFRQAYQSRARDRTTLFLVALLKTGIPSEEYARGRTRFEEALSEDRKRIGNAGIAEALDRAYEWPIAADFCNTICQ